MEDPGELKKQANIEDVDGTWREAITIAFETTRIAFPGGEVLAHLDHKLVRNQSHNNFELAATLIFVFKFAPAPTQSLIVKFI